jgi:chromosome segregation ATPase
MTKAFEQKIKMSEESKEMLNRKNQELLRALQDMERKINGLESESYDEVNRLREDNASISPEVNQLNFLVSKLKSEIAEKDNMLGRSMNNNEQELQMLRQQLEMKKQELFQAGKSLSNMQVMMKEQESENERKRRELMDRSNMFESEARKYKEEYARICDILKSKINDTINNTVGQRR